MADFESSEISVRYFTDLWGVYRFQFPTCTSATANDGVIPFGDSISSVDVKAYIGNVGPKSDLGEFTAISASLIDPAYAPQVDGEFILVKFQYPGSWRAGEKCTLIFEITTSAAGKYPFFFKYVKIQGQS